MLCYIMLCNAVLCFALFIASVSFIAVTLCDYFLLFAKDDQTLLG